VVATLKSMLYALYTGGTLFALGFVGSYLLWTRWLDLLPAWVTLGGTILVAASAGLYAFVEHRAGRV
jgi:hypothetical protein